MLQSIRDRLVGWVAWGIVILIGVPFAIMGVTDFGSSAAQLTVAEAGDISIDQRDYQQQLQNRRSQMQKQLGALYNPDLYDAKIQKQVVNNLIEEALLKELAEQNNIQISDKELSAIIQSDPEFQKGGQFDFNLYRSKLGGQGLTTAAYEEYLRNNLMMSIIPRTIRSSSFAVAKDVERYHQLLAHKRDIDYVVIDRNHFPDDVEVGEENAKAYYENHKEEFVRPEQVRLEYIRLSVSSLIEKIKVDDESIRQYYEENADQYISPEQRQASHILIALPQGQELADNEDARQKYESVQTALASGSDFSEIAKQYSDDPGSAENGGDLGMVVRGVMVPPFEQALFAMTEVGSVSEPVRTSFGYHFIRLDAIKENATQTFEDAKSEVRQSFVERQAEDMFYDISERMAELSYENQGSLSVVSESLDIPLQTTDWVAQENNELGVAGNAKILAEAFSENFLQGDNSDPIEINDKDVVVMRLLDHREKHQLAYEDVQDQVKIKAALAAKDQQIKQLAESMVARVEGGESFSQLAEQTALIFETPEPIGRDDFSLPDHMSLEVFKLEIPEENKFNMTAIPLRDGKYGVVKLRGIVMPSSSDDMQLKKQLSQRFAAQSAQSVVAGMRKAANVIIHEDNL